jgi:thiol-disulfide isomerase/thioredoxin
MKNSILLILIISICSFSCMQKTEEKERSIIISGKIENLTQEKFQVFLHDEELLESQVQDEGYFHLKFASDGNGHYLVQNGDLRFTLYLEPGDSIFIRADNQDFGSTFEAEADKSLENIYLREKWKVLYESLYENMMELMGHPKEIYFVKKDSILSLVKKPLVDLKTTEKANKHFLDMEENFFKYQSLSLDNMYPRYHSNIQKISQEDVDFPVDSIQGLISQIPMDDPKLLEVESYKSLLESKLNKLATDLIENDSTLKYQDAYWMAIERMLPNREMQDFFKFESVYYEIYFYGPVGSQTQIDKFLAENHSRKYAARLEKAIAKWEPINPGKETPDFTFTNLEGKEVKLSDLRGQLVYIDIWATWCGPCIAEHPHWDKLKEEFKDQPIAFLTISIDDTREPWEKMVKSKKMTGMQWFAENAWQSEIARHFQINSIPRFILLDEEGKIINPSADRPSGSIRETFEKHLQG